MFKYFNPLWLIQNLLQPSINPITIGAGVGAVGSAVTGKSPIKGALLGGALGGVGSSLFSGAAGSAAQGATAAQGAGTGLFGSTEGISPFTPTGIATSSGGQVMNSALTGLEKIGGIAGEQSIAQNAPLYTGSTGMFDVGGTQNQILGGIGQQVAQGGGGYDTSLLGSIKRGAESGYNTLADWTKANPMQALSTTGQLVSAVTPEPMPQPNMPPAAQIKPGSYNTAPTLGQGPNEKVASRIQFTPQQLQLYPSFYRGGY